jgi:hypothetical protein
MGHKRRKKESEKGLQQQTRPSTLSSVPFFEAEQGDQIGRIFAYWATV